MNRLFVFDVDGTLLPDYQESLPATTREALNSLLRQGDAICIASGRPFSGIHAFLAELDAGRKFAGIANGAMLKDFAGNLLWAKYLPMSALVYFHSKYRDDPSIVIYGYGLDDDILFYEDSSFTKMELDINSMKPIRLIEGQENPNQKLLKVMVASKDRELSKSLRLSKEESLLYDSTRTRPEFFEIIPIGASKGECSEELRKYLRIDEKDVYCFGDSSNDFSMVSRFNGVAMGNACLEVKEAAKWISKECKDDGVSYALKEILRFVD